MTLAILLPAAYIVGSINFSILVFGLLGKDDPRNRFSGNAGVMNVYRQAGLFVAGMVFLLDIGRALTISWAALHWLATNDVPWMGFVFIVGNRYPCFHHFRGGKGVAGYLGFTALISPLSAGISAVVWIGVYKIIRIPFIASFFMITVLAVGTIMACKYRISATMGVIATAIFIFHNHRQNISDFISGRKAAAVNTSKHLFEKRSSTHTPSSS
ncbi:MAG: glycerol-3-phosphate acyltransferase [Syntrophales bacterium]|jgi:glycerol-3-phosphate acyltransferase PlsY